MVTKWRSRSRDGGIGASVYWASDICTAVISSASANFRLDRAHLHSVALFVEHNNVILHSGPVRRALLEVGVDCELLLSYCCLCHIYPSRVSNLIWRSRVTSFKDHFSFYDPFLMSTYQEVVCRNLDLMDEDFILRSESYAHVKLDSGNSTWTVVFVIVA